MKTKWILSYFLLSSTFLKGQSCESIYYNSVRLFKEGNYNLALKKLAAYKICAPSNLTKSDSLILLIYNTVNKQRNEAINQRNIANKRASTIKVQRDSIEKEYFASIAATKALQENVLDPTKAIQYVNAGLCLSPQNSSLLEIRKSLLVNEVLRKNLVGSSSSNTLCVERLNQSVVVTGDAEGKIKLWYSESGTLVIEKKLFEGAITGICILSETKILVTGNESNDHRRLCYKLKLIDTENYNTITSDSCFTSAIYMAKTEAESTALIATENGDFYQYNSETNTINKYKTSTSKIVGLKSWRQQKKIFYATPNGVYDFQTNSELYKVPQEKFITHLGFCPETGDLYIGIGSTILVYNYIRRNQQLLYPIHSGMVTSCNCASEEGTFLSTGLDGLAVLWTSSGNVNKVLKGSRGELYAGYLAPDESFAVTVGRRELTNGFQADTNTVKYWYLKDFLKKRNKEVHFMGATAAIYTENLHFFITGGTDGKVIVWNKELVQIDSRKLADNGISSLAWDRENNELIFGTFSGEIGKINVNSIGLAGNSTIKKVLPNGATLVLAANGRIYVGGKSKFLYRLQTNNTLDSILINSPITSMRLSKSKKFILLTTGKKASIFNIALKTKKDYLHQVDVKAIDWISENQFVTISGQYIRIWQVDNNQTPIIQVDNAIRSTMMSLFVDRANNYIYTGTWNGYLFCYDYNGRLLYELHKMPSHILAITADEALRIVGVDYDGNVAMFLTPNAFQRTELKLEYDCTSLLNYFKKN